MNLTLISIKFPNVLIFVGGDFNARVGDLNSFDEEVTDGLNGRTLSDCPAQYTFYNSNGCLVIDLVY